MTYRKLTSSSIEQVGYDAPSATLAICFHNGAVYLYSPVPEPLYVGLIEAPSAGSYFHQNIRNAGLHYQCVSPERPNLLTTRDL